MKSLDGGSLSGDKYSGPIGSLLPDVESFPIDFNFTVLDACLVPEISIEAISKLNSDQQYFMKLVIIITTGEVPENFEHYNIGKVGLTKHGFYC